jgi:hypothetical protein
MSRELVRKIESAYGEVDSSATGQMPRASIEQLGRALSGAGDVERVIALWSAARALAFPQIATRWVEGAVRALHAARSAIETGIRVRPAEVDALLAPDAPGKPWDERQLEARRCLGHALSFCVDPSPLRFASTIESMGVAQRDASLTPQKAKQTWTGWLDDVVSRADRFTLADLIALADRTIRGTVELLPAWYRWEGAANDKHHLEVWTEDPRTRKLVMPVMRLEALKLDGAVLTVTVMASPDMVRDPLRIEYLVEDVVHRRFLGGLYDGRYERIDYRCLATGEAWQVPA